MCCRPCPSKSPVARKESIPGISIPGTMENGAPGATSLKSFGGSEFIGWYSADNEPRTCLRGTVARRHCAHDAHDGGDSDAARAKRCSRLRRRYQFLHPITTTAPVIHPHSTEWKNLPDSHRVAHDSPEIHHLVSYSVGVEDHPDRMLHPAVGDEYPKRGEGCSERRQPGGRKVESLLTLSQPNNITAMKVAFIKKAKMPSMASGVRICRRRTRNSC